MFVFLFVLVFALLGGLLRVTWLNGFEAGAFDGETRMRRMFERFDAGRVDGKA